MGVIYLFMGRIRIFPHLLSVHIAKLNDQDKRWIFEVRIPPTSPYSPWLGLGLALKGALAKGWRLGMCKY